LFKTIANPFAHFFYVPDYQRSDVQVFIDAISLCLRRDNNYDVLSLAGIGFLNQSRSLVLLPPWIPNFALSPTPRILTFCPQHPNRAGFSSLESVELKPEFRCEDGRLIVKGAIVDTIKTYKENKSGKQ
jgi:hypothetical protein